MIDDENVPSALFSCAFNVHFSFMATGQEDNPKIAKVEWAGSAGQGERQGTLAYDLLSTNDRFDRLRETGELDVALWAREVATGAMIRYLEEMVANLKNPATSDHPRALGAPKASA